MPIPVPSLDDLTYADLVAEATDLLGVYAPEWTDHGPSDPGIAIVELLAWLTEMLVYQVDQVPAAHVESFLRLLNGPEWKQSPAGLVADTRSTLRWLREPYRAVTAADYEYLVRQLEPTIARVHVLPERDLAAASSERKAAAAPGHVSVLVVPAPTESGTGDELPHPEPSAELIASVSAMLDDRRLLGTQVHVLGPEYLPIGLTAEIALREDAALKLADDGDPQVLKEIRQWLQQHLSPLGGGAAGTGRPLGRDVYASEIYALIHRHPMVEYVTKVRLTTDPLGVATDATKDGITVADHQLVRLTRLQLTGLDAGGDRHPLEWSS